MTMEAYPWVPALTEMFGAVRTFLMGRGRRARGGVGTNPKGQETLAFDAGAEEAAVEFCRLHIPLPLQLLSEERGEILTRTDLGAPRFTLIIDPVDGSENFKRGIELTCFSAAVLPTGAPLCPASVVAGLIGNVFTGSSQTAVRGQGAVADGEPLRVSGVTVLAQAMVAVECEFDKPDCGARIASLLPAAGYTRYLGSAVAIQMGLAGGGIDGYVDVRGGLTPENFMAGALVIEEAGGIMTDPRGRPLPPFRQMTDGFMVVGSSTPGLHREILAALRIEASR
jgi:myo-inositol-1(or 4)-monophosphatase